MLVCNKYADLTKIIENKSKIYIAGSGGAGKSTLARMLSKQKNSPIIYLDRLFWKSNWEPASSQEFIDKVNDHTRSSSYILDGCYENFVDTLLEKSDAVVLVHSPPLLCLYRILKRSFFNLNHERPDGPIGCVETFSWSYLKFLWWVFTFSKVERKLIAACKSNGKYLVYYKNY